MFVKEEQPLNAPSLIVVNPSGKVMFVKEEQSQNAQSLIVINPSGKVMFVKEGQLRNADSPILCQSLWQGNVCQKRTITKCSISNRC